MAQYYRTKGKKPKAKPDSDDDFDPEAIPKNPYASEQLDFLHGPALETLLRSFEMDAAKHGAKPGVDAAQFTEALAQALAKKAAEMVETKARHAHYADMPDDPSQEF